MDENVLAAVNGNEAITLFGVEPLHRALCHVYSHRAVAGPKPCEARVIVAVPHSYTPCGRGFSHLNAQLRPRRTVHDRAAQITPYGVAYAKRNHIARLCRNSDTQRARNGC